MHKTVKVSVIVPVYNSAKYLTQCIGSILAQTLKDIEVICVDDGSVDGSGQMLDQYAARDARVKVFHQENRGYGAAMNIGLTEAKGCYIGIVESDDCILSEMYETLYGAAAADDIEVVKSDAYYWYESAGYRKRIHRENLEAYYDKDLYDMDRNLFFDFYMNIWTGIYKREFLEREGICFHESRGASYQDNGFWIQTMMYCRSAKWLNKAFYLYRQDNEMSSIKSKKKVMAMTREYEYVEKRLLERKDYKNLPYCYYYKLFRHRGNFFRIADEDKLDFCKQMRRDYLDYKGYIKGAQSMDGWFCRVLSDPQDFCKEIITAKSNIQNRLNSAEGLIIYGAGKHGDIVFRGLFKEGYYEKIMCFAATETGDVFEMAGKPVLQIDMAVKEYPGALIIIAVVKGSGMYHEMAKKLEKLEIDEYLAGSEIESSFYII